jgi:hypothetical protein
MFIAKMPITATPRTMSSVTMRSPGAVVAMVVPSARELSVAARPHQGGRGEGRYASGGLLWSWM